MQDVNSDTIITKQSGSRGKKAIVIKYSEIRKINPQLIHFILLFQISMKSRCFLLRYLHIIIWDSE